jgi:hypothetical protein
MWLAKRKVQALKSAKMQTVGMMRERGDGDFEN